MSDTDTAGSKEDRGYRIECLECGSIAFGDPDDSLKWDKRHHRAHYCADADFKVSYD